MRKFLSARPATTSPFVLAGQNSDCDPLTHLHATYTRHALSTNCICWSKQETMGLHIRLSATDIVTMLALLMVKFMPDTNTIPTALAADKPLVLNLSDLDGRTRAVRRAKEIARQFTTALG